MIKQRSSACISSMNFAISGADVFGSFLNKYFSTAPAIRGANESALSERLSLARASNRAAPSFIKLWWLVDSTGVDNLGLNPITLSSGLMHKHRLLTRNWR